MKQYDDVKVVGFRDDRFLHQTHCYQRNPLIGDVGVILEDYGDAFEIECSDSEGITIWLEAMFADEVQPI